MGFSAGSLALKAATRFVADNIGDLFSCAAYELPKLAVNFVASPIKAVGNQGVMTVDTVVRNVCDLTHLKNPEVAQWGAKTALQIQNYVDLKTEEFAPRSQYIDLINKLKLLEMSPFSITDLIGPGILLGLCTYKAVDKLLAKNEVIDSLCKFFRVTHGLITAKQQTVGYVAHHLGVRVLVVPAIQRPAFEALKRATYETAGKILSMTMWGLGAALTYQGITEHLINQAGSSPKEAQNIANAVMLYSTFAVAGTVAIKDIAKKYFNDRCAAAEGKQAELKEAEERAKTANARREKLLDPSRLQRLKPVSTEANARIIQQQNRSSTDAQNGGHGTFGLKIG